MVEGLSELFIQEDRDAAFRSQSHAPGSRASLPSQTRLSGEIPSGFRMFLVPFYWVPMPDQCTVRVRPPSDAFLCVIPPQLKSTCIHGASLDSLFPQISVVAKETCYKVSISASNSRNGRCVYGESLLATVPVGAFTR